MKRFLPFLVIFLSLSSLALLSAQTKHSVIASGITFNPADITIQAGDTVEWTNVSGTHNVNGSAPSNPEQFSSGAPAPAPWDYSHVFNTPGLHSYVCDIHVGSGMTGTVTVLEPTGPFVQIEAGSNLQFQAPFNDPFPRIGVLQVTAFNPPSGNTQFLNIGHQIFLPSGDISQPYWSVQNLEIPPFPDTMELSLWFDVDPNDSLEFPPEGIFISGTIEDTVSKNEPAWPAFNFLPMGPPEIYDIGPFNTGDASFLGPIPGALPGFDFNQPDTLFSVRRGCTVPNVDLDSSANNPNTIPGYAGDWNACGPASTANSFSWLGQQHPEIGGPLLGKYGTGNNQLRELLEGFSDAMGRQPNQGVTQEEALQGKLALIDECELPIRVKFQSLVLDEDIESPDPSFGHRADNQNEPVDPIFPNAKISMDWIAQEMEDGEDVELFVGWYNPDNGTVEAAHMVVVTGVTNVNDNWTVWFKDDTDQSQPGGMRHGETGAVPITGTTPELEGVIHLPQLSFNGLTCIVLGAFSESYDPTVNFFPLALESISPVKHISPFSGDDNSLEFAFNTIFYPGCDPFTGNVLIRHPDSSDFKWVIANAHIEPIPGLDTTGFKVRVPLKSFGFDTIPESIDYFVRTSDSIHTTKPTPIEPEIVSLPLTSISPIEVNIEDNIILNQDSIPSTPFITDLNIDPNDSLFLVFDPADTVNSVRRGCNVPNVDLDSSSHGPTADYAGDWNACAPAAAANSIQWLRKEHPEIDNILKAKYGEGDSSLRKLLEQLSSCMGRQPNQGVYPLNGKLAFADKCKLPLRIKYQSNFFSGNRPSPDTTYGHFAEDQSANTNKSGGKVTMDWILQEMKEGEDVELDVHWWNPTSNSWVAAHDVVVTGVQKEGDKWTLYYKDDSDQSKETSSTDLTKPTCTAANPLAGSGWIHLPGMDYNGNFAYITSAYSESFDKTVTFFPAKLTSGSPKPVQNKNLSPGAPNALEFSFTYDSDPAFDPFWLNILVWNSDSAKFLWVAQENIEPISNLNETGFRIYTPLEHVGFDSLPDSLKYALVVSDSPRTIKPTPIPIEIVELSLVSIDPIIIDFENNLFGNPETDSIPTLEFADDLSINPNDGSPPAVAEDSVPSIRRGCNVPNIDLDSLKNGPTPEYAGDWNACAPAATANSFQWLRKQHPEIDTILKQKFGEGDTSHRKLLEQLSACMEREPREGAFPLNGKLAFVDKCKLPVRIKYQSNIFSGDRNSPDTTYGHFAEDQSAPTDSTNPGGGVTMEWLFQEMEEDEDVELDIHWWNPDSMKWTYAHAVVLTGVKKEGDNWKIYMKDDPDQDKETSSETLMKTTCSKADTIPSGWIHLPALDVGNNFAYITSAYSESFDETVTFIPKFQGNLQPKRVNKIAIQSPAPDGNPGIGEMHLDYFVPIGDPTLFATLFYFPEGSADPTPIVTNMQLAGFEDTMKISFWFDLDPDNTGFDPNTVVELAGLVTDTVQEEFPDSDSLIRFTMPLFTGGYDIGAEGAIPPPDAAILGPGAPDSLPPANYKLANDTTARVLRGCNVPNIDLDSSAYPPGSSPGYAGDFNACMPAATANSFMWLRKKHTIIDSLLKQKFGEGDTAHRKLLTMFSNLMMRQNNRGPQLRNIIRAKLALIDSCRLPMSVKFQSLFIRDSVIASPDTTFGHTAENQSEETDTSKPFAYVSMDWIFREMKAGEDVELNIQWFNPDSNKYVHAHGVVVTGITITNGNWKLYLKDDKYQRVPTTTNGPRRRDSIRHYCTGAVCLPDSLGLGDNWRGIIYLPNLRWDNNYPVIGGAYSESFDSTVNFIPTLGANFQPEEARRVESAAAPGAFGRQIELSYSSYIPPEGQTVFVNGLAKLPGSPDTTCVWAIPNLQLDPFIDTLHPSVFLLDVDVESIISAGAVDLAFVVSDTIMPDKPSISNFFTYPLGSETYDIGESYLDTVTFGAPGPPDAAPDWEAEPGTDSVRRGCEVPNVELDSMTNGPTPEYAGDWNACGPASTANSFGWLRMQHPRIDTILKQKFGEGDTSLRNLLEFMSELMDRQDRQGANGRQMLRGKLALIDSCDLPVSVKFQSVPIREDVASPDSSSGHFADNQNEPVDTNVNPNATISMDWIFNEMEEGEDVELGVIWYEIDSGKVRGGHAVVLTGIQRTRGNYRIWMKDDAEQDTAGGRRHPHADIYEVPDNNTIEQSFRGMNVLRQWSNGDTICFITGAFSESFDSTVLHCSTDVDLEGNVPGGRYGSRDSLTLRNATVNTGEILQAFASEINVRTETDFEEGSNVTLQSGGCPPSETPVFGSLYYPEESSSRETEPAIQPEHVTKSDSRLMLYPNPTRNLLYFQTDSEELYGKAIQVRVLSGMGKLIKFDEQTYTGTNYIDMSDLEPGMYYLQVVGKDQKWIERFIKLE